MLRAKRGSEAGRTACRANGLPFGEAGARGGALGTVRRAAVAACAVCCGLLFFFGCSQVPKVELPAPESGKFLTLEEQRALSRGQLKEYCAMLDAYLQELRDDVELARSLQDSLSAVGDSLQTEQVRVSTESRRIEREMAEAKSRRPGPVTYQVREGDTLTSLANLFYGSTADWRKIYEANKEIISDPQKALPAGQRITIP